MNWGFGLKSAKMGFENTGIVERMLPSAGRCNMYLYDINDGEYIRLRGVDFGEKSARQFVISAAATGACTLTLRIDAPDGQEIGKMTITSTGSVEKYRQLSAKVKNVVGKHDLYLCFSQAKGDVRLDWWKFKK
jgi:hypothetical protein